MLHSTAIILSVLKGIQKEDVIWTFEFPTTADVFGAQAKQYLAKLRYACEVRLTPTRYS